MDSVLRPLVIYAFILLLFRSFGKRSVAQITVFDFVLLLLIGESAQQALLGNDFSIVNAVVVITTLVSLDVGLDALGTRFPALANVVEGRPLVVAQDGELFEKRMRRCRVDLGDILSAARATQGLERLEQVKYAVVERDGTITVIPRAAG